GLERLAKTDPQFSPKSFIDGARIAYEMIVDAFARGDKTALKPLLARDVYDGFAKAIDAREAEGQKLESRFVGIDKAEFAAVDLNGKRAAITVKFVSELISATLSKSGAVIEGDPKQVREIADVWTFERDVGSRDPNWKLAATDEPA
ncbi:MAG TPA: Tim44/TimA family putative adaptor protein, partial [Aestuariivirga sp.]|nr:Tim44/TimA family putative adaptor protein [Aestuariivirga sp.]